MKKSNKRHYNSYNIRTKTTEFIICIVYLGNN